MFSFLSNISNLRLSLDHIKLIIIIYRVAGHWREVRRSVAPTWWLTRRSGRNLHLKYFFLDSRIFYLIFKLLPGSWVISSEWKAGPNYKN